MMSKMFFLKLFIFLTTLGVVISVHLSRDEIRTNQVQGRRLGIIGGKNTSITQHPYQIALLHGDNEFRCSAAVLNKRWAVTLAECVFEVTPNNFKLRTGSDDALSGGNVYRVSRFVVYPKYNNMTVDYDFALLKTRRPFKFGKKLKPIKLAATTPRTGLKATVTGWGWISVNISFAHVLQEAQSKVMNHKKCRENYKAIFTGRMICSYSKDSGPCYASDYGSLLVAHNRLYGHFSWGFGCGDQTYPPVYTNLAAVRKWIQNTIKT